MPYLDWNATAPPLPAAVEAMRDAAARAWGNPASVHAVGRAARARVEDAREAVAALASADPRDVILTGGGTEANNLALRSAFADASSSAPAPLLVTSRLEHPSITRVAEALEREGKARVRWLRVLPDGRIDLADLAAALDEAEVRLVTVQALNHETGVIQPVGDVLDLARTRAARDGSRVFVHVDAVQAFGKIAPERLAPSLRADTISVAGHKMRGPKGIGALVTRLGARIAPVLLGGAQERGLRPGTVDPVSAAGLAVAARHALASSARFEPALAPLRDVLHAGLAALGAVPTIAAPIGAASPPRAPHVVSVAFPGWRGAELVAAFDLEGLCVSSGSACSAGTIEPSPVVTAVRGAELAASAVRFSLGEETTRADIDEALAIVARVTARRP